MKSKTQTEAETLELSLLTLIERQWKIHATHLISCIEKSGGQESILRELVNTGFK